MPLQTSFEELVKKHFLKKINSSQQIIAGECTFLGSDWGVLTLLDRLTSPWDKKQLGSHSVPRSRQEGRKICPPSQSPIASPAKADSEGEI